MSSDLDTKYSKFNKDSPGVVSDLLLQLEVGPSGLVAPARPQGKSKVKNSPVNDRGEGEEVGESSYRDSSPQLCAREGEAQKIHAAHAALRWHCPHQ